MTEIAGNIQSNASDINNRSSGGGTPNQISVQPNHCVNGDVRQASSLHSQDNPTMVVDGHEPLVQTVLPMQPGLDEMAVASGHADIFDREDRQGRNNGAYFIDTMRDFRSCTTLS